MTDDSILPWMEVEVAMLPQVWHLWSKDRYDRGLRPCPFWPLDQPTGPGSVWGRLKPGSQYDLLKPGGQYALLHMFSKMANCPWCLTYLKAKESP